MNKATKAKLVEGLKHHHHLDQIQQGDWFDPDTNKGCHIGCCGDVFNLPPQQDNFTQLAQVLDVPEWFLRLQEKIFEGLPQSQAKQFSLDVVQAIPTDYDLNQIRPALEISRMGFLLTNQTLPDDVKQVITAVKQLWIKDPNQTQPERWSAAGSAAESAAESAWSTAWSAESAWSTESAARSAAESAWSAWSAAWQRERDVLLKELNDA